MNKKLKAALILALIICVIFSIAVLFATFPTVMLPTFFTLVVLGIIYVTWDLIYSILKDNC